MINPIDNILVTPTHGLVIGILNRYLISRKTAPMPGVMWSILFRKYLYEKADSFVYNTIKILMTPRNLKTSL